MDGKSRELRVVVAVIAFKMLSDTNGRPYSSYDIGLSLAGLQNIDCKSCPEVLILLDKISKRLKAEKAEMPLITRHAALALYGLQSLTPFAAEHQEIRDILSVLVER